MYHVLMNLIHTLTPFLFKIYFNTTPLPPHPTYVRLFKVLVLERFLAIICMHFLAHQCLSAACQTDLMLLSICLKIQNVTLFLMQLLGPVVTSLLPLNSKYSPHHPVLEHFPSVSFS